MGSSLETITPLCTHVTRSVASGFSPVPFARRAFPKQNYRAIFRLTTVEKAMLNNDLRCCMPLPPPSPFVDIPRIYGVVAGMSVAKPVYRKTAAVVVRNNYCSGRRARLRTRLQGVFYARTVNSRGTRRTESRTSEFVLVAGDELRAVKLFLPLKNHSRHTGSIRSCFGYIKSLAKLSAMRFAERSNYVETLYMFLQCFPKKSMDQL